MKMAINAASAKMGGALQYITSLVRYLPSLAPDLEVLVFLPPETADKFRNVRAPNLRLFPVSVSHGSWWRRLWWDQVTFRRFICREKVNVLFAIGNFGSWRCGAYQILLVNNALYFSELYERIFASKHSLWSRVALRLRRLLAIQSVRNADVIFTPSVAMLEDLRRFTEVNPGRVVVNPYGVEQAQVALRETREPSAVRLLYVSLYAEHKNLSTLLKAIPLLNGGGSERFEITTLANPSWEGAHWTRTAQLDLNLIRRRDIRDHLNLAGPLSHDETLSLYYRADILVFPSLIESFGFPMVEAMAHGLPIVAADTLINREICQDAALYFAPLDEVDLARQVVRVCRDRDLKSSLATAGLARARRYRWEDHVCRLIQAARMGAAFQAATGTAEGGIA
jgi:glycosyltransferase involved in cell wall biosynthesis